MISQMATFIGGILASEEKMEARQADQEIFWKSHKTSLQAEVDSFFIAAANVFLSVPNAGLWSFLSSIPFAFLSADATWKISIGWSPYAPYFANLLSFFSFSLFFLSLSLSQPCLDTPPRKGLKLSGRKLVGITCSPRT